MLQFSVPVFHHSFLKKIKKTITVSAQEIECLSHNINVSSKKISPGKNLERQEGATKENQSSRTREALICIQKFQSQRFLQNEKNRRKTRKRPLIQLLLGYSNQTASNQQI